MERLHPAYFALVMATGIVAIACHLLGLERIAQGLLPVNVAAYVTLAALNLARAVWYPARLKCSGHVARSPSAARGLA